MNGDDPKPPADDPVKLYQEVAAKPDDPHGDRAFLEEKRAEGGLKKKPRGERRTKITTEDIPAPSSFTPEEIAAMTAEAERLKALRADVMKLERVDIEALTAEEEKLSRGEYDLGWTPGADGLPPHCPVTPLGIKRSTFYFLTPKCEMVELAAGNFGQAHMDALFAPQTSYLLAMFGSTTQKGGKRIKYEGVRRTLMDACARKDVFDPSDKVRGRGAWKGEDGKLILHNGDKVLINGAEESPGLIGEFVYPARPRLLPPLGDGGEDARQAARQLLLWLECWPWRRGAIDARFMLGWIVASMMGAAIDWRPQVMLTADAGMGKSTLQHLLKAVSKDRIIDVADASAAGLYQTLGYDALGVAFDEFENEDEAKGAAVMRLARLASSGGRITRGGADGVPTNYQARGAFLFSAINPPAMRPAEQSRTTILALGKYADGSKAPIINAREAEEIGRRLVARIIRMWSFWPSRLDIFRARLASIKHTNRGQDQYGALLAAADLVLQDADPTRDEWDEFEHVLDPAAMGETAGALPNWRRCLNHILAYQPDGWRSDRFKQIGGALEAYVNRYVEDDLEKKEAWNYTDLRAHLSLVGLALVKVQVDGKDVDFLGVPPRHPGLAKVFDATDWSARRGADGAWINALSQAPEVMWLRDRFRIGGAREYGLLIRLDAVLEKEEEKGNDT